MNQEQTLALLAEARTYRELERYPEALENLHQLAGQEPDNPNYLYLLGSTYLESKNTEFAKKYAALTLEKKPDSKEAFELLGLINEAEKKYTEAEKYYLKSLVIDPEFFNARYLLVQLYSNCFFPERLNQYQQGYKEVFTDYSKVIEQCNILLKDYDIQKLNKLKSKEKYYIGGNYYSISKYLVIAYYKQANFQQTIKALEQIITIARDIWGKGANVFRDLINIFKLTYKVGDTEKSEQYLEEIKSQCVTEKDYQELKTNMIEEAEKGEIYL